MDLLHTTFVSLGITFSELGGLGGFVPSVLSSL